LVIGQDNSDLIKAEKIENYYGFSNPISGHDLLSSGIEQTERLGTKVLTSEVVGILYDEEFIVKTVEGQYRTKAVILATGSKRNVQKIKGIEKYEKKGISYCAICDGFFYKNKDVAVLGDGEYAISEALELANVANKITILSNGTESRETRHPKIVYNNKKIREFRGNESYIEKVEFEDDTSLDVSGIFIAEGTASSTDLAKKLGINIEKNAIKVDESMCTNIPGIFACGDCTGGLAQISKAVYEGTIAGLSAIAFVKQKK